MGFLTCEAIEHSLHLSRWELWLLKDNRKRTLNVRNILDAVTGIYLKLSGWDFVVEACQYKNNNCCWLWSPDSSYIFYDQLSPIAILSTPSVTFLLLSFFPPPCFFCFLASCSSIGAGRTNGNFSLYTEIQQGKQIYMEWAYVNIPVLIFKSKLSVFYEYKLLKTEDILLHLILALWLAIVYFHLMVYCSKKSLLSGTKSKCCNSVLTLRELLQLVAFSAILGGQL